MASDENCFSGNFVNSRMNHRPLRMGPKDRHHSSSSEFNTAVSGPSSVSAPSTHENLHDTLDWSSRRGVVDVIPEDSFPNAFDGEDEGSLFVLSPTPVRKTTYTEKCTTRSSSTLTTVSDTHDDGNNNIDDIIKLNQPMVQLLSKATSDGDSTMVSSYRIGSAVSISAKERLMHQHLSVYPGLETIEATPQKSTRHGWVDAMRDHRDLSIDFVDDFGFKANDAGMFATNSLPTNRDNDKGPQSPSTVSSLEVRYTPFSKFSPDSVAPCSSRCDEDRDVVYPVRERVVTTKRIPVNKVGDLRDEATVQDFLERLGSLAGCAGNNVDDDSNDDRALRLIGGSKSGLPDQLSQPKTTDVPNGIMQVFDLFFDCIEPPRENGYDLTSHASFKSSVVDDDTAPRARSSSCVGDVDFSKNSTVNVIEKGDVDRDSKDGIASASDDAEWPFPFWDGQDSTVRVATHLRGRSRTPRGNGTTNSRISNVLRRGDSDPDTNLHESSNNSNDPSSILSTVESPEKDRSAVDTNKTAWATFEQELERTDSVGDDSDESLSNIFEGLDFDPPLDENDDLNSVLGCLDRSSHRKNPTIEGASSSTLNYSSFTS